MGRRVAPSEALTPFVHHFWAVEWDLRTPFTAEVLPHPTACLTVELGHRQEIAGVRTGRTHAIRKGAGRVFGWRSVTVARTARRLRDEFELDAHGVAVLTRFAERIRELEEELRQVRAQLRR